MKWTRTRAASALAVGTASVVLLSACGTSETPSEEVSHAPVTISVGYWGNFGLENLEAQYEADHPWVDLQLVTGDYSAQHDLLQQSLIAGSGAYNLSAIDEGFITGFVSQADGFVNLLDLGAGKYKDRYLPWKWAQASNADETVTIGLGSDVGGMAMCYRHDLFEAAGLPADRDAVDAAMDNSWDNFVTLGQQYVAGSGGKKFVDNATNILNPAVTQLGTGYVYYDRNNQLDMDNVKPAFDIAVGIIEAGLSANIAAWSPEWNAGFQNGDFAVLACPAWMLGYITGQVDSESFAGKWDIADLPGPGGNWGGSFYTIPKQGTAYEQSETYAFIEWLVEPEQQLAIMKDAGNLPSQQSILESDELSSFVNEFFNNAPYGEIFAESALAIPGAIYYAPNHNAIRSAVESVLNDVQAGNVAIADAWDAAVAAAEAADAAA